MPLPCLPLADATGSDIKLLSSVRGGVEGLRGEEWSGERGGAIYFGVQEVLLCGGCFISFPRAMVGQERRDFPPFLLSFVWDTLHSLHGLNVACYFFPAFSVIVFHFFLSSAWKLRVAVRLGE